jgi:hypothetical protein
MSYLRYLCLFAHSNVQHILCCVFICFAFLRLVYPMLPVSLDCPFLIFPSVFSNVYLNNYGQQFHQYERKQTPILPHFGNKRTIYMRYILQSKMEIHKAINSLYIN